MNIGCGAALPPRLGAFGDEEGGADAALNLRSDLRHSPRRQAYVCPAPASVSAMGNRLHAAVAYHAIADRRMSDPMNFLHISYERGGGSSSSSHIPAESISRLAVTEYLPSEFGGRFGNRGREKAFLGGKIAKKARILLKNALFLVSHEVPKSNSCKIKEIPQKYFDRGIFYITFVNERL